MKVVNLTPHEVTVYDDDDVVIKTYPSEGLARASQVSQCTYRCVVLPDEEVAAASKH